jgi:hypothetical protein
VGTGPARAIAAGMGIEALLDDDAVQLTTARTAAPERVFGAPVACHSAVQTVRCRGWTHLVVAVPVAPPAQERGGLLPQGALEVRWQRRSAARP